MDNTDLPFSGVLLLFICTSEILLSVDMLQVSQFTTTDCSDMNSKYVLLYSLTCALTSDF